MSKKTIISVAAVGIIALGGYWAIHGFGKTSDTGFEFGEIVRGSIEQTVTAAGSLSPVTTVEVGTQVSGTIDRIFVDFNDIVKEGQLLAVLDTSLLKVAVTDAEASVERTEANLEKAYSDYLRNKELLERRLISEADFIPYKTSYLIQQADLKSTKANLKKAKQNLDYAIITSPINGIVIGKNVESGQTVAASLSAPTLFEIAEDLSRMEILADVDESDIGYIKTGQEVRFEVTAYAGKEFSGVVKQIRLKPEVVSNVVTYTVVVEADNPDGLLLPGMTATLDFIIEKKDNVLLIANKALRFMPSREELQSLRDKRGKARGEAGENSRGDRQPPLSRFADGVTGIKQNDNRKVVWYVNSGGELAPAPLVTGMTDGANTEIIASRALEEGMQVIISAKSETKSKGSSSQRKGGFGGPPGGRGF
ncbi:MAG: efflux RND transporter periplasmic adaptor subunit [candidate division Zixibacteria bacterium]|nr:efflux RND transporter periplasmic adaptor subunit [candidate division Zixibacteria bacterium]